MKKIRDILAIIKEKSKEVLPLFLKYHLVILLVVVLLSAFYWFQLRPSIIKKDCYREAKADAIEKSNREDIENGIQGGRGFMKEDYDAYYKWCLQSKGI